MRYAILCLMLVGCGDSEALNVLKTSLRDYEETVVKRSQAVEEKTDEAIVILRDNTAALTAIKTKVESIEGSILETRQTVGTLEASLAKSEPQNGKDGDPASAPDPPAKANTQPTAVEVATPGGSRITSDGTVLRWNIEGNWNPTILETSAHLREHGIDTNGMTHQEMADIHAAIHEGKPVATKAKAVRAPFTEWTKHGFSTYYQQSNCPNGQCPTSTRFVQRRRR